MGHDVKTASPVDTATRFLVEFDSACSLYRLYGAEHPAFQRQTQAAASTVESPLNLSVTPHGFAQNDESPIANVDLVKLAQRLRALGLIALNIQTGLTAKQVESFVSAIDEAERKHQTGEATVTSISTRTDHHIQGVALKLDGLRLVEGTAEPSAASDPKSFWDPLFSSKANANAAADLAASFERSLRGTQSTAHWKAMVDVWLRELTEAEKSAPADAKEARGPRRLDAVASFLQRLSPPMCQRLLTETISDHSHSQETVLSLAERLPTGTVLGALSSVSRSSGGPSTAALALLRRCSTQVMGTAAQDLAPVTNEELAEAASTLSNLLGSDHEGTFVPTEYLRRREQLSHPAAESSSPEAFVTWPDERQTMNHAAQLIFEILSTPNASIKHLIAALEYMKNRVQIWVRASEFVLAAEAMGLAQVLGMHESPEVAKSAQSLQSTSISFDDLLVGARQALDRDQATGAIADLLGRAQGAVLAGVVVTAKHSGADQSGQIVNAAIARTFPKLSTQSLQTLFASSKDSLPPFLLTVLQAMSDSDALQAAQILLSAAPPAARHPLVELIFRGKQPWPVPLIEHLLKDGDRNVRRLAAMRLVRDANLASAAAILQTAAGPGQYEPDVGVFLAELLHHHRRDPALRSAYRQWWWSPRRWSALFSWRPEDRRQAG
jgi:hypothetical protein